MRRQPVLAMAGCLLFLGFHAAPVQAQTGSVAVAVEPNVSTLHAVLTYLPNRLFDVLDPVRARLRIGPGFCVGIRVTEVADAFLGAYASVYAGLPGPRGGRTIPLPAGVEAHGGVELSVAELGGDGGLLGPGYGATEIGLGFQVALLGLDVGVDPFEVVDLILGLLCIDIGDDDF